MALGSQRKTCRNCGQKYSGPSFRSPTGGEVCRNCHDVTAGATIGVMSGGGLGTAVGIAGNDREKGGLLNWIRRARRGSSKN